MRRYPDVNDARAIRIEATAKARRILERGRARRVEALEGLLAEATGPRSRLCTERRRCWSGRSNRLE